MAQKGRCACCGKECTLTVDGKIWHHHPEGDNAEACYQSADSKRCKGAGELPEGARPGPTGDEIKFLCRVPSGPTGCGHQVQLTANRRARSHQTPQGVSCAEGGSAFPIAVGPDGYRADTADWTEADWERVFPKPVRGGEILPGAAPEELRIESGRDFDPRPPGLGDVFKNDARNTTVTPRAVETIDLPHDRQEPSAECEHDWGGADVLNDQGDEDQVTACNKCGLLYPEDDEPFDVTHDFEEPEPPAPEWGTPPDLLAQMPADAVALYAAEPPCWDCGDRPMLAVETFRPDGGVGVWAWTCDRNCEHVQGSGHYGRPCRPQAPWEERLGHLERGDHFRRHNARGLLAELVYRVEAVSLGGVDIASVIVVSAGRHHGRTGELTDLSEEITCTDQNGQRLRRRALGTGDTSPTTPSSPPSPRPPTPSRPAATTQPTPARGSRPTTKATAPPATSTTSSRATASGPTATAGTKPRSAVTDAFTTAKQAANEGDRYDRFGRYKLTHPATGKPVKWTRATTYAKSIADTYNLSMWSQRMVLKGASLRPDIVAAVSTLDVKEDRDRINGLVEDAKKAAGNKVAANLGTALHAFTEDRDKALVGIPVKAKAIPDNLRPSVDAYEALLREFGLVPVPGLIEFTTAVLQYEIAGTSDRCYKVTRDITFKLKNRTVTLYAGEYVIGDVKSGADLSYGWMEICIQLAIYAQGINASGVFDWNTATWGRPVTPEDPSVQIKVRTDVGLIPHLPVDRKDGDPLATLFAVDLDWGWATAVLCGQVRTARKEGNLATALTVADVADGPAEAPSTQSVLVRPATLEEKAQAVTTQAAASEVWKEAVAARTPKAEVERLVQIMRAKLESLVEQGA